MQSRAKVWIWQGVSLALAAGLLAYLLGRQKWPVLTAEFRHADIGCLLAAAGLAIAYWLVRVARWRWMTSLESERIGWRRAWVSMLAGLAIGLATPFRGGEVTRPLFLSPGVRLKLAGWVVVERFFDLAGVLLLCLLGLVYLVAADVKLAGANIPKAALAACPLLLCGALGLPLLLHYRPAGLWRLLERLLPGKAKQLAEVTLPWRPFGVFLVTSILAEALSVLAVYFCLRAYGPIGLLTAAALTPVVMLNNLIPATPGGFGVREALAVAVFGAFGFTQSMVLAAYLTNALIVLLIPACIGIVAAWASGIGHRVVVGGSGDPPTDLEEDRGRDARGTHGQDAHATCGTAACGCEHGRDAHATCGTGARDTEHGQDAHATERGRDARDTIRLIVNADDFGWSKGITDGIVYGHRHGIITSTTLAVNMPACEYAIELARPAPQLGVGIHLNACQGPALSEKGRKVLAGDDGVMDSTGDRVIKGCLFHPGRFLPAIEAEFAAQIERALSLGLHPTHVDSHRHVHGWPAVFRIVLGLCRRYDIPRIRRYAPAVTRSALPPGPVKQRRLEFLLNWLGRRNGQAAGQVLATKGTIGVANTGGIDAAFLLAAIEALPAGATEIMVHPGYAEDVPDGQTRLRKSRRGELDALCDEAVKECVRRRGVELIHYGLL